MVAATSISTRSGGVLVVNCSVVELHLLDIENLHLNFVNLCTRLQCNTLFGIHSLIYCTLHTQMIFLLELYITYF